jgi:hypothetical protein
MGNVIRFDCLHREYIGDQNMADITKEKMMEIEKKTGELLKGIDLETSPYVDIVSIVKKDHFDVQPQEMDADTTGCLFVNDDALKTERKIYVNTRFRNLDNDEDVVFKKSRFITAHEYAHFILHKKDGKPIYAHRDTDHRTEPMELEADYFARSILMPLNIFRVYCDVARDVANEDEDFTVMILSRVFGVTKNKVRRRMEDLEVLGK